MLSMVSLTPDYINIHVSSNSINRCEVVFNERTSSVPFTEVCKDVGAIVGVFLFPFRKSKWVFKVTLPRNKGYDKTGSVS